MSIPVIIIGGFLGAGKTTVVNRLLRHAAERIAVLVNDFGPLNIDEALLAREGEVFALANGCVCCSIGPDFSATLSRILAMEPAPERIIVEASGVSDPWRIAQLVKLNKGARLDAVLVLADALELPAQYADRWLRDTLERQIARADVICLSKCDIARETARNAAYATLNAIRPGVSVIEIANGVLPQGLMTPLHERKASALIADAPGHDIGQWSWTPPGPLDEARLRAALAALPASIWRGKGLLTLADGRRLVLQLVGRRWSLGPYDGAAPDALVLLGTGEMPLDAELARQFAAALA
jgi:G3E family GTPase